ncbi:MAG: IS110 family transposase [Pseudomonadota bacterium]
MTNDQKSTKGRVIVALDIAKSSHDAAIQLINGKRLNTKIPNTKDGYQTLIERCGVTSDRIDVGFEPTADYHRNIAYWLADAGCDCYLVSSLPCARAREMLHNTWDKNDRKDASVVLYLMNQGISEPFHDPLVSGVMDIQELSNTYHQLQKARTLLLHSLFNHYVTLYFPEMEQYFNSSRAEWFCRFMLKFPTPASICRYRKSTFIKRAWDVVGRKVNKESFLSHLYDQASQSIGLPVALDSVAVDTFRLQLVRFADITDQRATLERQADGFLSDRSDYQRLRSIPGIGPILAMMIIAESGDLRRFKHYRQYLSFSGFNLAAQQSGVSKGQYRLSKRGNSRLRYAFWLAATQAVKSKENSFREKFRRYIAKDPDNKDLRRKARTAVAGKMARVAHALVKTDRDYQGYYEFSRGT